MPDDLKSLRQRLLKNPSARAKLLADLLSTLKANGVDVDDPKVLKSLNLDFDLTDGRKFVESLKMSTVVITLVS